MKTASNKAKGRNGQKEIVKILLESFPELVDDDVRSCPMGSPGEDILLSTKARKLIPWNIEVKRGKAFNLVKAVKQADFRPNKFTSVAMGRYDRDKKWYACVELEYLLKLLKKGN